MSQNSIRVIIIKYKMESKKKSVKGSSTESAVSTNNLELRRSVHSVLEPGTVLDIGKKRRGAKSDGDCRRTIE